jgi:hypothetical protein
MLETLRLVRANIASVANIIMDDPPGSRLRLWRAAQVSAQPSERWPAEVRALESVHWRAARAASFTIG